MTSYAQQLASTLLKTHADERSFKVTLPKPDEAVIVASYLRERGCSVELQSDGITLQVTVPEVVRETPWREGFSVW